MYMYNPQITWSEHRTKICCIFMNCTHFLNYLTLCTLIVIVMVYWFKLVALILARAAPAQSLTVTPSVVEWVKFSRNLQQITLLRPRAHCSAAPCWLVCESMHHQFTKCEHCSKEGDFYSYMPSVMAKTKGLMNVFHNEIINSILINAYWRRI